ncbi:MAG: response regulator, partial [Cyanobacteria bacterium J06641_5]
MSQNNLKQYSILVVDDTKENLHLLVTMLGSHEYLIRPTPSGHQALRVAKTDPPDLILLDIKMPDIDGYQVCQQLKANEHTKDIPII